MRKWFIAVVLGVLAPLPINLLAQYLAQLEAETGNVWIGYALSALVFLSYFFLGVYLAGLGRLRAAGAARRVRWAEFALGAVLLLISLAMRLEQAAGLVTANVEFIRNSDILTRALGFSDGLYLWAVLAGFFMTDAFGRVPAQAEAQAAAQTAGARTKKVKAKKSRGKAAQAQPAAVEAAQAALPGASEALQAKAEQAQPAASEAVQAKVEQAQPAQVQPAQAQPTASEAVRASAESPQAQPGA